MIQINNSFIRGFIQEKSITAVWAEKERTSGLASHGGWKVMIRSDGQDYLYCHRNSEYSACEEINEIEKMISRYKGE